jgi:hypothetical protein
MRHRLLVASSLFIFTTGFDGCPIASVEVDVSEVCVSHDVEVGATDGSSTTASFTVDDFGKLGELAGQDSEAQFTALRFPDLAAKAPAAQISQARAAIASGNPDAALPTLEVACDGNCTDIAVPAELEANAVGYIRSGSIVVELELHGSGLPTEAWSAKVDVCMAGAFAYSVGN